jgi:hypothetical protein
MPVEESAVADCSVPKKETATVAPGAKGHVADTEAVAGALEVFDVVRLIVVLVEHCVGVEFVVGEVDPAAPATPGMVASRPETPSTNTAAALPIRLRTEASFSDSGGVPATDAP